MKVDLFGVFTDAEDFQPQPLAVARGDKWEGEDEDADIKVFGWI
jgi:hypothetical protein